MERPIDAAMAADRPPKRTVRELWMTVIEEEQGHAGATPLYLTLCGAAGHEIDLLIERGILQTTSTGAIDEAYAGRVVAVESSKNAMADLKKKFPGLDALGVRVEELLAGFERGSMPQGINRRRSQAKIVNLDYNGDLDARSVAGAPVWLQLELVVKLAVLHRENPSTWYLFLTVNSAIGWTSPIQQAAVLFLKENIDSFAQFRDQCTRLFEPSTLDGILNGRLVPSNLDATGRQRFLMAFVPKRIAADVTHEGWRLVTVANIHYGDDDLHSAMVTWIFRFDWDPSARSRPMTVYREVVGSILERCAELTEDGERVDIA